MDLIRKGLIPPFSVCFFLLTLILTGCSKQEEQWIYDVSSNIVEDKSDIEGKHPDIMGEYQSMITVAVELTSKFTADLTNLDVRLNFPQNKTMKLYSQGSSSSTVVKTNDKVEYLFDIILDQSMSETKSLLDQSKIIVEWEAGEKKERMDISGLYDEGTQ